MNINYALANAIHSQVVANTCVDSYLLTDDNEYTSLLTKAINENHQNVDTAKIVSILCDYVNSIY